MMTTTLFPQSLADQLAEIQARVRNTPPNPQHGIAKIGALAVKPSESLKNFKPNQGKFVDWVTLASLRDSENGLQAFEKALAWIAPALLFAATSTAVQASCVPEQLSLNEKSQATAADIVLHEPDGDQQGNRSWLGPVTAGNCTLDTDLFTGPVAIAQQRYLFLVHYSGSQKWLAVYDLQQCRQHWRSKTLFGEAKLLNGNYQFTAAGKTIHFNDACKGRTK